MWNLLQIAELVATEFFDQGDKERKELNIEPTVSGRIMQNHLFQNGFYKEHFTFLSKATISPTDQNIGPTPSLSS